jgi:hypothetical protein
MATINCIGWNAWAFGIKCSIHHSSKVGFNPFHFLTEMSVLGYFRRYSTEQNYIRETTADGGNDSCSGFLVYDTVLSCRWVLSRMMVPMLRRNILFQSSG